LSAIHNTAFCHIKGRVLSDKPAATMETTVLQLQVRNWKSLSAELWQADINFQWCKWLL